MLLFFAHSARENHVALTNEPKLTPFTIFGQCTPLAARQPLLDAALVRLASSRPQHSPSFSYFHIFLESIILYRPLISTSTHSHNMPVLEKNIDHEPSRDQEREKDRDREGKDREKGPKTKSSTKCMA